MQPYPDIPFKVSGLDPAILEAWTRRGLYGSSRTTDVMHPDRLTSLRSLVRKNPLISKDALIKAGNILERNERWAISSKSVSSREAKQRAAQTKEMAKEVQGSIEALKKRMDVSEELEDRGDGDRVTQGAPPKAAVARATTSSPLFGVKVGPSLSTKLNYILSEVCLYLGIDDATTSCMLVGPTILREGKVPDILQFSSNALSNRRGFVTIRNQASAVH